jgi:GLPGLI family protein
MKKLVTVFAVLINTLTFGQNANCIRVDYVESIGLDKSLDLDSALAEQLKGLLPDKIEMYNQLYLIGNKGVYGTDKVKMEEQMAEQKKKQQASGGPVFIDMGGTPQNSLFADLEKQTTVEQRDFMGKLFLIEGKIEPISWKITGNKKTILSYEVLEATAKVGDEQVTAWFTASIKSEMGPVGMTGLPGLILELEYPDSQRKIVALKIDQNEKDTSKVQAPSKGKKITEDEFNKMVEQKTKEMQEQFSGRDQGLIIKMD